MTRRERCEAFLSNYGNVFEMHPFEVEALETFAKDIEAALTSTWTTTPPKEKGWYWFRSKLRSRMIVYWPDDMKSDLALNAADGEWSDRPIQGPGEDKPDMTTRN